MNSREVFEKICVKRNWAVEFDQRKDGSYRDDATDYLWKSWNKAWIESRNQLLAELRDKINEAATIDVRQGCYTIDINECLAILDAAKGDGV